MSHSTNESIAWEIICHDSFDEMIFMSLFQRQFITAESMCDSMRQKLNTGVRISSKNNIFLRFCISSYHNRVEKTDVFFQINLQNTYISVVLSENPFSMLRHHRNSITKKNTAKKMCRRNKWLKQEKQAFFVWVIQWQNTPTKFNVNHVASWTNNHIISHAIHISTFFSAAATAANPSKNPIEIQKIYTIKSILILCTQ